MGRMILTMLAAFLTASAASAATPQVPAVWKKHEYSFVFMGFTATYSCDGLADKLKVLLLASGARSDVSARSGGCPGGFGQPDRLARADVTFYSLAPVTEGTSDSTTVQGTWKAVRIQDHMPRELQRGDCELVEQFTSTILPMFSTRNLDSHTSCTPHQTSGSVINLSFEALTGPAPTPAGKVSK